MLLVLKINDEDYNLLLIESLNLKTKFLKNSIDKSPKLTISISKDMKTVIM